jgi:biotin operon repressor
MATSDPRKARALELRAPPYEWGYKRIARELGVSRDRVRYWVNPEHRAQMKQRERQRLYRRHSCATCGGPTLGDRVACKPCQSAHRRFKAEIIVTMWSLGYKGDEIAAYLGMTVRTLRSQITRLREEGWDLPLRRSGWARAARWERIRELWLDGALMREIAVELGTTEANVGNNMNRMRKAGVDLPHRYPMRDGKRVAA